MSVVGNISPVSTTTIRPSCSTAVMFLPISPSPPSGRTLSRAVKRRRPRPAPGATSCDVPLCRAAGDEEALALERGPHRGALVLAGRDHRQTHMTFHYAQHLQRGLDRNRIAGHGGRLVDRLKVGVPLLNAGPLAFDRGLVHGAHLGSDQVRGDQDAASPTQLETAEE